MNKMFIALLVKPAKTAEEKQISKVKNRLANLEFEKPSSSGKNISPQTAIIPIEKTENIKPKVEEEQAPERNTHEKSIGDAELVNIAEKTEQDKEELEEKEEALHLNLQKKTDMVTEEVFKYLLEELGQGNPYFVSIHLIIFRARNSRKRTCCRKS